MEGGTFRAPKIQKEFERFVEIRIHQDHQEFRNQNKELQRQLVDSLAIPYYVLLDANGNVVWGKAGIVSEDDFLAALKRVP